MKRISSLVSLLLSLGLVACAQQPLRINPACAFPATPNTVLLTINREHNDSREQLVLHTQIQADGLELVALNPVGAKLFTGKIRAGLIETEVAAFYRGADARTLIWAYSLWQQRDNAPVCWPNGSKQLGQLSDGSLTLTEGKQAVAIWHPRSAGIIELPRASLRLGIRVMD